MRVGTGLGCPGGLHLYLSMFTFGTLLFFSVTGFTLNHNDWFGGDEERVTEIAGVFDLSWLSKPEYENPDKENTAV